MIYLDHQATTPTDPAVLTAMVRASERHFANPSSAHGPGVAAFSLVEKSRASIARFLGARTSEIYFTSGATEANNLAIKGVATQGSGHLITTAVEHKSVLDCCDFLRGKGYDVTVLPVDREGRIDPQQVADNLRDDTVLVSVMLANNEVATIQPIREIARITRHAGVPLHCDATQGAGYLELVGLGVNLLSLSGHKIYGPKGVGVLFVSNDLTETGVIAPAFHGGGQERGLRAGTLNTAGIAGLGVAVDLVRERRADEGRRLADLRTLFLEELAVDYQLNSGTGQGFLPHALNLWLPGVDASRLVGVAVSTGSACNSASQRPSHVLTAMGLPPERIGASVRLSFGRFTTEEEVVRAARILSSAAGPGLVGLAA